MKLDNVYTGKPIPLKYHILFWASYFTLNVLRWGIFHNDYWTSFRDNIIEFSLHLTLVYTNFFYLIPKFLITKKYKQYLAYMLAMLTVFLFIRAELYHIFLWKTENFIHRVFAPKNIIAVIVGEIYVLAFTMAIRLTIDWIRERNEIEALQREQLETELKFLKAQIQPHFFFNTLNNLYALTLSKSDMAPKVVLKLSDIMQYVLYEIQEAKVALVKEISYVRNYIDLEKLRCNKNATFKVTTKGNIDNIKVPALLFLSFVENAFKHGSRNDNDFFITIEFKNKDNQFLLFSIENKYTKKVIAKNKEGIGNENIKKRLNLLFRDNFTLTTTETACNYGVQLKIPI